MIDEEVNLSLLHAVMHYQIFVTQLRPSLDTLMPIFASMNQVIMFLPLVITRLLMAYFDRPSTQAQKPVFLSSLVLIKTLLDQSLLCWFHARCLGVYKHLQSLIAHTIAMNHYVDLQIGREVYDKHLLRVLYAECSYPETEIDLQPKMLLSPRGSHTLAC